MLVKFAAVTFRHTCCPLWTLLALPIVNENWAVAVKDSSRNATSKPEENFVIVSEFGM